MGSLVSPGLLSPQIHWPASQQRIEECILSGKNSNVSGHHEYPSGSNGGVGGQPWRGICVLVSYSGKVISQVPCSSAAPEAVPGWGGTPRC